MVFIDGHKDRELIYQTHYRAPMVPFDVPFEQWRKYIINNIEYKRVARKEANYTVMDIKEDTTFWYRCVILHYLYEKSYDMWTDRDIRLKELVRNGTDFAVPQDELSLLLEN